MNYKEVGMRNTEVIAETKLQEEAMISRTLPLTLDKPQAKSKKKSRGTD